MPLESACLSFHWNYAHLSKPRWHSFDPITEIIRLPLLLFVFEVPNMSAPSIYWYHQGNIAFQFLLSRDHGISKLYLNAGRQWYFTNPLCSWITDDQSRSILEFKRPETTSDPITATDTCWRKIVCMPFLSHLFFNLEDLDDREISNIWMGF